MHKIAALTALMGMLGGMNAWGRGRLPSFGLGRGIETGVRNGVDYDRTYAAGLGLVQVLITYKTELPKEADKLEAMAAEAFTATKVMGCTGSVVAPRFVLTAAHCVPKEHKQKVSYLKEPVSPDARAEVLSLDRGDSFELVYKLAYVSVRHEFNAPVPVIAHVAHPNFTGRIADGISPDVAVLEVADDLPEPYLAIAPERAVPGTPVLVAGFGDKGHNAPSESVRNAVFRAGFNEIEEVQGGGFRDLYMTRFLLLSGFDQNYPEAGLGTHVSVGHGDSGGPLVDVEKREIVGVASAVSAKIQRRQISVPVDSEKPELGSRKLDVGVNVSFYIDLSDPLVQTFLRKQLPESAFTAKDPAYVSYDLRYPRSGEFLDPDAPSRQP